MGSRQSEVQEEEWHEGEWESMEQKERNFGRARTLRSRRTGAMVDQYQLSWTNEQEFQFYLKSFHWRHRTRNHPAIVSSTSFKEVCRGEICSGKWAANVYLEHVGMRLSQIEDIPINDALYMLLQAIDGYQLLYLHSGYFRVQEEQICIDRIGRVKVWVNSDLSRNYPDCDSEADFSRKDQTNMVQQLIDMVVVNTDPEEQPPISLIQYLSRVRKRQGHQVGFQFAKIVILEYSKMYQIPISTRFETILELYKVQNSQMETSIVQETHLPMPHYLQHHQSYVHLPPQQYYQPHMPSPPPLISYQSMPEIHAPPPVYSSQPPRYDMPPFRQVQPNPERLPQQQHQPTGRCDDSRARQISRNSKSHMACLQETTQNQSMHFPDEQADDRNTMKSMPMRHHSTYRDHPNFQKQRYSQFTEEIFSQKEFDPRPLNHDSFGLVNHPRKRMKESSSSYKIGSSGSSSRNQRCEQRASIMEVCHKSNKSNKSNKSSKSKKSSNRQSEKHWGNKSREPMWGKPNQHPWNNQGTRYFVSLGQQWELDPEIEADIRKYLG